MQLEYVPGACNIGPEEIARRQRVARIGLVATVALALALLALGVGVGSPTRLFVGLPLTGAAIGWIQARRDRKSTRLNSSHSQQSRMPSSA